MVGRNAPCPCGSGKKHKLCCGKISQTLNKSVDKTYQNDNVTDENEWIVPYWVKVQDGIKEHFTELTKEKLTHLNFPLYKYCSVLENAKNPDKTYRDWDIENFENDQVFLQIPNKFNDPFDCFVGLSQPAFLRENLIQALKKQKKHTKELETVIDMFLSEEAAEAYEQQVEQLKNGEIITILQEVMKNDEFIEMMQAQAVQEGVPVEIFKEVINSKIFQQFIPSMIDDSTTNEDKTKFMIALWDIPSFKKYMLSRKTLDMPDEDYINMQKDFLSAKSNLSPTDQEKTEANLFSDNIFGAFQTMFEFLQPENMIDFDLAKKQVDEVSQKYMLAAKEIVNKFYRISCFSKVYDSPLMWSHYANKHYGFCLEYDFTNQYYLNKGDLPAAQVCLFPVIYSKKRPIIPKNLLNVIKYANKKGNNINSPTSREMAELMKCLLYKSKDWEYAQEWRLMGLVSENEPSLMKLPNTVKRVFLGTNMEVDKRERIIQIANKKRIPIYQMYLKPDSYKFDYYRIKEDNNEE